MEQRSALVTALRAKLGVSESGPGEARTPSTGTLAPSQAIPTDDSFADAMAQLDRGLDARQKLIGALRSQLSRHAAYPKASAEQTSAGEPAEDAGPLLLDEPLAVSAEGGFEPIEIPHQQEVLPDIVEVSPDELPPAKRMRPAGEPTSVASCPSPASAPGPDAVAAPCGDSVDDAEKAALEARKAAMLKSLKAAEASKQTPDTTAPSLPPAQHPSGDILQTAPEGTVPQPQPPMAGQPLPSTAPPHPSAPPMPPCPAGATPEQYEAWRQQCWQLYWEWCSVWQKYYTQNQNEQRNGKAGAQSKARGGPPGGAGGCVVGAGRGCPPAQSATPPPQLQQQQQQRPQQQQQSALLSQAAAAARGRGAAMATWPPGASVPAAVASRPAVIPPLPRPDAMVAGRPKAHLPLPAVRSLIEDDIHGKLLGL